MFYCFQSELSSIVFFFVSSFSRSQFLGLYGRRKPELVQDDFDVTFDEHAFSYLLQSLNEDILIWALVICKMTAIGFEFVWQILIPQDVFPLDMRWLSAHSRKDATSIVQNLPSMGASTEQGSLLYLMSFKFEKVWMLSYFELVTGIISEWFLDLLLYLLEPAVYFPRCCSIFVL